MNASGSCTSDCGDVYVKHMTTVRLILLRQSISLVLIYVVCLKLLISISKETGMPSLPNLKKRKITISYNQLPTKQL